MRGNVRSFVHNRAMVGTGSSTCWCGLVLLLACTSYVHAQPATLRGFVTDRTDGQPIELANVVLQQQDELVKGTVTNRDGLYLLPGIEPGTYTLQVTFIGFQSYVDTLTLASDEARTINIALVPTEAELDEVIVESERDASVARVIAGQQTIRPSEVEQVPSPDVSGDLANYLTTLPGIVSAGDRGGQLFIRGGESTQNLVQLDDILLYQPFHILGFYSAFPSEIINRADVYAGGFGSEFGGRLSSVIDITTRNGNMRTYAGSVSLSPFVSALNLEGPVIEDRLSVLVSGRTSVIEEGAAQYIGEPLLFSFNDAFAKLHGVLTDNTRVSATVLRTHDQGTIAQDTGGQPPEEIRWTNEAAGLRYLVLPRAFAIMLDIHLSFSRMQNELGPTDTPFRTSSIENTTVSIEGTYFGDRIDAYAGSTVRTSSIKSLIGGLYQNLALGLSSVSNWGSYLEFDFDVGSGLHVRPGLRAQFYNVRFGAFLEPRLRLIWERGVHRISGATGLYQQEVLGLSDRRDAANVFIAWTNVPREGSSRGALGNGKPQRALHGILGYQVQPTRWLDLSIEGFYKDLSNLFVAEWTAFPRLTTRLQPAEGRSLGFDARVEVRRPHFYGYVNYGLSSTRYEAKQAAIELWYGTESLDFRPPHDRRHQVNALASTSLYGFDLSVRWFFGSGLPFSQAQGFDGFALIDDLEKASEIPGTRRVIYERPFNAVLPTVHRLDVSLERTFDLGRTDMTVQGSVINAYDRNNIFYLDVFTLRRVDQLPVVPSLGLKMAFE